MDEQETLQKIVKAMRSAFQVRRVVLFGSHATGTARPSSDYDILVIVDSEIPLVLRQGIARVALESEVEITADLIVLTQAEFEKAHAKSYSVIRTAIETGKVLYAA